MRVSPVAAVLFCCVCCCRSPAKVGFLCGIRGGIPAFSFPVSLFSKALMEGLFLFDCREEIILEEHEPDGR
jgi:hypothetical protein